MYTAGCARLYISHRPDVGTHHTQVIYSYSTEFTEYFIVDMAAAAAVVPCTPLSGMPLGELLGGQGLAGNGEQFVASIADAAATLLVSQERSSTNPGRKLRFRKAEEVAADVNIVAKWEEWRLTLREAIETRSVSCARVIQERAWQFDAGISMLCGLDTTVIAATSDGKSFAYQILSIVSQGSSLLGVFPLISLQNDQVCLNRRIFRSVF